MSAPQLGGHLAAQVQRVNGHDRAVTVDLLHLHDQAADETLADDHYEVIALQLLDVHPGDAPSEERPVGGLLKAHAVGDGVDLILRVRRGIHRIPHDVLGVGRERHDAIPGPQMRDVGANRIHDAGERIAHGFRIDRVLTGVASADLRAAADKADDGSDSHLSRSRLGNRHILDDDVVLAFRLCGSLHIWVSHARTSRYETTVRRSARASGYGRCARSFQICAADWYLAASSV